MNILLTGATGLLGSAVLPLLAAQYNLTVISRKNNNITNFPEINWVICDLTGGINFDRLPDTIDVVIHLAQSQSHNDFPNNMLDIYEVNVASTMNLLNYAYQAGAKYFIYSSTGSVYFPYDGLLNESEFLVPVDFYANSKLAAERLVLSFSKFFSVCVFRLFFLYGSTVNDSLVSRLIGKIKNEEHIFIDGSDGGLIFTPTFNHDVAKCIHQAVVNPLQGIYNFAGNKIVSIKDIALEIGSILGVPPLFSYHPNKKAFKIMPDISKIYSSNPSVTFTDLEKGLQSVV